MDLTFFTNAVALSALAVVIVHQFLKFNFVPVSFANRYPVPTNIVLSIIASVIVFFQSNQVHAHTWSNWLVLVASISVTAAITYNQLLKPWPQLRATESQPPTQGQ